MTVTARTMHLTRLLVVVALVLLGVPLLSPAARASTTPVTTNLDLDPHCGIDIALIIDRSGSIGTNNANVRNAAQSLVNALVGSGSKVQVASFSSTATAEPGSSSNIANLAFVDPAGLTIPLFSSSGTTNWDDALEITRRAGKIAPLTFMITDGDPTIHNNTTPDGHGGATSSSAADLENAVVEANLLKAKPSHMFVVGVGNALSNAASENRIKDITGPDKLTFDGSGNPNIAFGTADYTLVTNFSDLQKTFAHFVRELCGPGLNAVKKLQLANGSTVTADGSKPFSYTATVTPTPSSWQSPAPNSGAAATLTTGSNGAANFKWEPNPASATSQVAVNEAAASGWVPNGQKCTLNKLDGTLPTVIQDNVGANAAGASKPAVFSITGGIGPDHSVSCEVFNRQLRTSTIAVEKITVPASRPEAFTFRLMQGTATLATASGITDASPAHTFAPVQPGSYSVTEDAAANYSATGATCDNTNTQAVETASPANLAVGEQQAWVCKFTNTAVNGTITVKKHVVSAPGGTFNFTSNIPGHATFALSPANNTDASVDFPVAPLPTGTYSVVETGPAPFVISSAACDDGSPVTAISVSPGEHITCTFNNTAPLPTISVTKTAGVGAVAEPGGPVTYSVSITNTSVAPLTLTELKDVVNGTTFNAFTQPGTCGPLSGTSIAIGATVNCTFTAPVSGDAGDVVADTVTAKATDAYQHTATGTAQASVNITNVAPTITITKTPNTPTVAEPGGPVTYTVALANTSDEAVTVTHLTDAVAGGAPFSITTVAAPVTATTCGLVTIAAHATSTCSFTVPVGGNAGTTAGTLVPDVVHARAIDNDGSAVTADANASVRITDAKPTIDVTKTASTSSVNEPGANVTFTVTVHNTSVEAVTISSVDDRVGGGPAVNVCANLLGDTLAPGATTTCSFTQAVTGSANSSISDTVTVHAHDNENNDASDAATATVRVNDVKPSLQVTKAANPTSVNEPGGLVSYTVNVHNTSVEPVTITAVTDAVGGGAAFGVCPSLVGSTLAPNAATACTFSLGVAGDAGDNITDTATVTANDDDGNSVNGTGQATVHVNDVNPTMSVAKSANRGSVPEPGGDVKYTASVHNTSPESIQLTALTDAVVGGGAPFAVTGVAGTTCALPQTIPSGASYSCDFTVHVVGNAGAVVADTVKATAHDNEQHQIVGEASASVAVTDVQPTITVTKVAATTSVPEPGADVSYLVTVHNTSVESVTISAVSDKIGGDAPFAVCASLIGVVLAPNGSASCRFTQAVAGDASDVVADTVTAVAHDDENNDVTGQGTESVTVTDVDPSMTVSKTASTTSVAEPGADVTYTAAVHNTSVEPLTLTNLSDKVGGGSSFSVTDVAGTTCSVPQTIAVGGTYSCTFPQYVSGDAGAVVSDTVTATGRDNENHEITAEGTESVNVTNVPPTGTVTKGAGAGAVPEPGAPVEFSVLVHNTSVEPVHITALTDSVAGGAPFDVTVVGGPVIATTCTDAIGKILAVGGEYSCRFTIAVTGNGDDSVTDVVAATLVDNEDGSTTPTDDSTVDVTDVLPTIVVTKTTNAGTVEAPGATVPFTVTITNTSPEPITIDSITDSVAGGPALDVTELLRGVTATTCVTGGVLAPVGSPGSSVTCQFSLLVGSLDAATYPDIVRVTGHDDEDNPAVDEAGATAVVTPVADLSVTKDVSQQLLAGGTGSYRINVHNNGPSNAEAVVVTDTLPAGLTAVSAAGDGWACTISAVATSAVCARAALAADATASIVVTVNVEASLNGSQVTNVVRVGATTKDKDPSNNEASVVSGVEGTRVLPLVLSRTGFSVYVWTLEALALMMLGWVVVGATRRNWSR